MLRFSRILFSAFVILAGSAFAEVNCPNPPSVKKSSSLSAMLVCPQGKSDKDVCLELPGPKGPVALQKSSRFSLIAKTADLKTDRSGEKVIHFQLEPDSACWLHKITDEHVQQSLALIYQNRVLIIPRIISPIPNGEVVLLVGTGDLSPDKALQLCREINPSCQPTLQ